MTEYWQSLPKKYCDVCKCWFADNKASVEFHERGLRHKGNVRRKLNELRKQGSKQILEQKLYNNEMMKIEAAAMKSFQNDVSANPSLARELASTSSVINKLPDFSRASSSSVVAKTGRFGETLVEEESTTLVRGRERALDTIAKSLERKSKWLEAKTAEGDVYYWNKDTFETKAKPPKTGFLSLEEQKRMNIMNAPGDMTSPTVTSSFKVKPYGKWQVVDNKPYDEKMIDLQLPNQTLSQLCAFEVEEKKPTEREKIVFEEKVVESIAPKRSAETTSFSFKKPKTEKKRCLRQRGDDQ